MIVARSINSSYNGEISTQFTLAPGSSHVNSSRLTSFIPNHTMRVAAVFAAVFAVGLSMGSPVSDCMLSCLNIITPLSQSASDDLSIRSLCDNYCLDKNSGTLTWSSTSTFTCNLALEPIIFIACGVLYLKFTILSNYKIQHIFDFIHSIGLRHKQLLVYMAFVCDLTRTHILNAAIEL